MITITGNPISINALYRGRRFLTENGKSKKKEYDIEIRRQWKKKIIKGDVEVCVDAYFKDKHRRDLDGIFKALLDSMSGLVYEDDSQIARLSIDRYYDKNSPRVEITIYEL